MRQNQAPTMVLFPKPAASASKYRIVFRLVASGNNNVRRYIHVPKVGNVVNQLHVLAGSRPMDSWSGKWSRRRLSTAAVDTPTQDLTTAELDFFGEPVTFRGSKKRTNAMAAYDGFLLCVVSKGRSTTGGGDGTYCE